MALTPFALLLLRNFSSENPNFHSRLPSLFRKTRAFWFSHGGQFKLFSTSQSSILQTERDIPKLSDPKTSLSDRMSFVFDQMDAIEKGRRGKDEALQRIRAWRETKKNNGEETSGLEISSTVESNSNSEMEREVKKRENLFTKDVEVVHPWPEWIELMERLVQQNYFDHRRKDEDLMLQNLPIDIAEFQEEGFDFPRDWSTVRTACFNFGRDRFDILRSLSRKDIQILVGHGCPSVENKVVFSAKLLRKHVHLDEGDVCSSCSLRSSCDRAYLLAPKEGEARTFDVMRILFTFCFDPVNGSIENKPLLKIKSVKTVVRKLLHEVVKLSAVPIDPNLPPPIMKKAPPKVKQPPPPPKKRVGRDDIEMKKGDWLCPKCDFMNFAKNTVCLQCDAKRPKRLLLPGEWECPKCNFLNYRRNMACFHCEHKRPPDEFMENQMQERPHGPVTRLARVASRPEVSGAWNFDFDDNESDGADVASFEFADPPRMGEDFPLESRAQGGNLRGFIGDISETSEIPRAEGGRNPDPDQRKSGMGFDDFDDEEDDIDSYELDTPNNNTRQEASSGGFSPVERYSESEDFDSSDHHSLARCRTNSPPYNKISRPMQRKTAFSGSERDERDSDEELSVRPSWKSSHVADSRQRTRGRGRSGQYRGITFGSDDELGLGSSSDDDLDKGFGSNRTKGNKWSSNRRDFRRGEKSDSEDGRPYGSESDESDLQSRKSKLRGSDRRGNIFKGRGHFDSARNSEFRSNGVTDRRRNNFSDANLDRSSRGSLRDNRGFPAEGYGGQRMNNIRSNSQNFSRPEQREGFRNQQRSKFNEFDHRSNMNRNFVNDRPRRRIIER
ncbi:hypothetical protein HHK36_020736 [Tetracentron sinense]|uniref:RanBP2-type domain-containing protein n=1 Tax=Tetracentron sinense TaxID=13715 RepID=A0A834YXL2_TETSI|nr:hypothetical protein HHK36_020736 [Tetracentron sinense]